MERLYFVYRFTFQDGKLYFGITTNPKARHSHEQKYSQQKVIYNALVAAGGIKNIQIDILAEGLTKENAMIMERGLIKQYDTTNPEKGYNTDRGEFVATGISKKDRMHEYYLAHKDKIYEQNERNRKANIERTRERARDNYWKNVEERRKYNRELSKSKRDSWTPEEREEANRKQREYKHSKRDYPTRKSFNK